MAGSNGQCILSSFILWETGSQYMVSDVILCTINAITAVPTMLCNLVSAIAMMKEGLITTPSCIINFSLSLVDLTAVLIARPLYIYLRMSLYSNHVTCHALALKAKATESVILLCTGCSFLHIVCLARVRCSALCKPEHYRTQAKMKETKWLVSGCWITWSVIVILLAWIIPEHAKSGFRASIAGILLGSLAWNHVKIALVVRRYKSLCYPRHRGR